MQTSAYQSMKLHIVDFIGLSKDAIHMHIGLAVFVSAILIWQKGKINFKCLIPVLLVATGMECIDLYDGYNAVGYFRWSNSIHDLVNTTFWPFIIVILFKLKKAVLKFS